jgi:hypothetical protein
MNKKLNTMIGAILVMAVTTITVAPPAVFGQTLLAPASSTVDLNVPSAPESRKPDLKKALAEAVANLKAGDSNAANLKRPGTQQQNPHSSGSTRPAFTRKEKIFLALFVVMMAGTVAALIKHGCKVPHSCDQIDNTDSSFDY